MVFNKFVEVGRVVLITYGEDKNKIAVITDIIDHNRVIVDGPCSGVARQPLSIKRLELTKIVMKLPRGARTGTVRKYFESEAVVTKWAETGVAKRIEKQAIRASSTDFDRFRVMVAQKKKSYILSQAN